MHERVLPRPLLTMKNSQFYIIVGLLMFIIEIHATGFFRLLDAVLASLFLILGAAFALKNQ